MTRFAILSAVLLLYVSAPPSLRAENSPAPNRPADPRFYGVNLSTYPSRPPASGPHDPVPQDAGVYTDPPPIYKTIHSLEHGAVVIWYSPTAPANLVGQLTSYFNSLNDDHVIVAPYSYPSQGAAGQFPAGKAMVLVAWHHMQECGNLNLAAARAFVHGYRYDSNRPADYKGDAPEKGVPI